MTDSVTVYVDGSPIVVPREVESLWAVRGALGIPRGIAFGVETNVERNGMVKRGWCLLPEPATSIKAGWEFEEGQLYKTFGLMEAIEGGLLDVDEDDEDPADWWKRSTSDERPKFFGRTVGRLIAGWPRHDASDDCLNDYLLKHRLARPYKGGTRRPWTDTELAGITERARAILDGEEDPEE